MSGMHRITRLLAITLLVLPLAALADEASLKAQMAKWEKAYNAGDAAAVAAIYADDAHVMPPGVDAVTGRAAIQSFWASGMKDVPTVTLESSDLQHSGGLAVETGEYTDKDANGEVLDHGKYVAVWMKTDGNWQIVRDIWNSSMSDGSD